MKIYNNKSTIYTPKQILKTKVNNNFTDNIHSFKQDYIKFNRYSFARMLSVETILEDKELSQHFMAENLKKNNSILGTPDNIKLLFNNDKIANNFAIFVKNFSLQQIKNANSGHLHINSEEIKAFQELANFFDDCIDIDKTTLINNAISFKGNFNKPTKVISKLDEIECRKVINAHAAACAATAAMVGKAAISGVDAWAQRGIQSNMFLQLQDYLNVPPSASVIYAATEYSSKAYLGVRASQYLNALIGISADALSSGTSVAATEAITRSTNGTLSFYLTRKMGLGYLEQVKSRQMSLSQQLTRSGQYAAQRLIMGGMIDTNTTMDDIQEFVKSGFSNGKGLDFVLDEDTLTEAIKNIPDDVKKLHSDIMDEIIKYSKERTSLVFLSNFIIPLIPLCKSKNGQTQLTTENFKNIALNALKNTLLIGVTYEICNMSTDSILSQTAQNYYNSIVKNINEDSELYSEFTKILNDVSEKIKINNLGKMDSNEFVSQFKDPTFVYELSRALRKEIKDYSNFFNKKNNENYKDSLMNLQTNALLAAQSERKLQKINDDATVQLLEKMVNKYNETSKSSNSVKTIGFAKVIGYEKEKAELINRFGILSVNSETTLPEEYPNVILLYGPRGIGKTLMLTSAMEQFGNPGTKRNFFGNKKQFFEGLLKIAQEHKRKYETSKNPKQYFLILDECTTFLSTPKTDEDKKVMDEFNEFIKTCGSKYHMSIFMTTNKPDLIYKPILSNNAISYKMPFGIADRDTIIKLLKYYCPKTSENIDYELIADKILEKAQNTKRAFSNTDIQNIAKGKITSLRINTGKNKIINQEKMLEAVENTLPEITEAEIDYFNKIKNKI